MSFPRIELQNIFASKQHIMPDTLTFTSSMSTGVKRSFRRTSIASNYSIRSRHSPTFRTEERKSRSSLLSAVFLRSTIRIIQYRTTQFFSKKSGSTSSSSSASVRKRSSETRLPSNTTSRLPTPF